MMQKLLVLLTFLTLFCGRIAAQTAVFPYKNQIVNKNFEAAESGILTDLSAEPNDCALNFAAGILYSDKDFVKFNTQKAYNYFKTSKIAYDKTKDKSKLLKAGLSAVNINKKILTVTQYALDEAVKSNSAEAYENFLSVYELAPLNQKKLAENKSIVYTFRKNYVPKWDYIKKYVNQTYNNQEFTEILKDSAFAVARRSPNVEVVKYCYINSRDQQRRDSCISMMHKIYEKCGVYNFDDFWRTYTSQNFKEQKEKDEIIKETYKSGNKLRLVIDAAPSRVAYDALLELIAVRLKNKDYEGALYKVSSFAPYFEGDKDYADLLKTLQQPENKEFNISKLDKNEKIVAMENTTDTTVSPDGSVMIFSQKKQSINEISPSKNLFICFRLSDGSWDTPQEINALNTSFSESSPYLHPDMKTLYFCSEGYGSLGKKDIFVVKRLGNGWDKWSRPKNLGREINTAFDEDYFKFSYNGTNAYYSNVNDNGNKNSFVIKLKNEDKAELSVTLVTGFLTDSKGHAVSAEIGWEDLEKHQIIGHVKTSEKDGSYTMCLPAGRNYGYFIDDKRFFPTSENLDLRQQSRTSTIKKDITVVKIEEVIIIGKSIILKNLFFETGASELLPASVSELNRISKVIQDRSLKVEISGHTDNVGNDADNQRLSLERAEAVKKFLITLGCDSKKLVTVGYGKNKPIAPNTTPEGRQQNRRVEFRVVK
ncbi:MAG: OmpA family protein [Bacteroidales bacterium]|nr:OmpA family protein [Bacteroidales bacterium]MEE3449009.1 OmpA family protein [Bacteroidales bacterium]